MLTEPFFWISLVMSVLIGMNFLQCERLRARFRRVLEREEHFTKCAAALLPYLESKREDSLQSDTNVHHEWELIRLRESVLELAYDLRHLAELQYITTHASFPSAKASEVIALIFGQSTQAAEPTWAGTLALTNHVFNRHTRLPDDLPSETKEHYEAGKWTCPVCEHEIENCWTGWCPTCGRLTAAMTQLVEHQPEANSAPEHEPTSPGHTFYEEFTCFACREVFLLTQHPLAATCPHCGARQIDVAI